MTTTPLLVVTADLPFGELLRQNLSETGRFNVHVTHELRSAVAFCKKTGCTAAFLDSDLGTNEVSEIAAALRSANDKMRFVLVTEAESGANLSELSPEDYLTKPFYLPDLLEIVGRLASSGKEQPSGPPSAPKPEEGIPWLADSARAAQHLTRLTLESSAQAALILHKDELWAYAGQLPQSATAELANTIMRYWDRQEESDLVRFVRLVSTGAEHMLYATRLASDMVLALVFDAETSFSTIRSQASQLVHSLAALPPQKEAHSEEAEEEITLSSFQELLSDIPSPNPPPEISIAPSWKETSPAIPLPAASAKKADQPSSQPAPLNLPLVTEETGASSESIEQTLKSAVITRKSKGQKHEPAPADMAETQPSSTVEAARKIVLEPTSPSVYNLDYACLLIPRFAHHHITGDLAERLGEWVPQICTAFGWRLEHIAVRPDYLQWIVNVPPSTSPGYLMRILRQNTSDKIFAEFPRFKKENPSGDFWAPGYLIMGGSQPPPVHLIKEFIAQSRRRQGISQQLK